MSECVTALCPTYGRFELLRDAVACFLLQSFKPRRMLILNDAPEPLHLTQTDTLLQVPGCSIDVWNIPKRYPTLGHKRQALLTGADSEYVAHWDDDDWYLPWHLQQNMDALRDSEVQCVKPHGAWFVKGHRKSVIASGPKHNVFEAAMSFNRKKAIELGGYSHKMSGQAKTLKGSFKQADLHNRFEPDLISFCCRWGHRGGHVSAIQDADRWGTANDDFGNGEPLIPNTADPVEWARDRMRQPFDRLCQTLPELELETERALREAYDRIAIE
jgi:hypothetical protein